MRKELESRIIAYSVNVLDIAEGMQKNFMGSHLANQVIRSGTSVSLNFGELQGAQSRKDFLHKASIIQKELRETIINLRIISEKNLCRNKELVSQIIKESDELIAIFYKTIQTCRKNQNS